MKQYFIVYQLEILQKDGNFFNTISTKAKQKFLWLDLEQIKELTEYSVHEIEQLIEKLEKKENDISFPAVTLLSIQNINL